MCRLIYADSARAGSFISITSSREGWPAGNRNDAEPTVSPPAGVAPLSVTVPVVEFPPVMLVGFSDSKERTGATGMTVSEADLVAPL